MQKRNIIFLGRKLEKLGLGKITPWDNANEPEGNRRNIFFHSEGQNTFLDNSSTSSLTSLVSRGLEDSSKSL